MPEPPPPLLLGEPNDPNPVTGTSDDQWVRVSLQHGRLTSVTVDRGTPPNRLEPAILQAVNDALEQANPGREFVAQANAVIAASTDRLTQEKAYNDQTLTYLQMLQRDLADQLDEAADFHLRQHRE